MRKSIRKELARDPHWLHKQTHNLSKAHIGICKWNVTEIGERILGK